MPEYKTEKPYDLLKELNDLVPYEPSSKDVDLPEVRTSDIADRVVRSQRKILRDIMEKRFF